MFAIILKSVMTTVFAAVRAVKEVFPVVEKLRPLRQQFH
jgi:hypothetical protein